jgi:N-acetylmuramoyl-L-alanine amidase
LIVNSVASIRRYPCIVLAALSLAACAGPQSGQSSFEGTRLAVAQYPSPNFDARRPNFVIIHHTSNDNADVALAVLANPERKVSAHYLIGRDGKIFQLVDERARAWHAGESYWGGQRDINSASIGVELDNNGSERFPDAQIDALVRLLADIRTRHNIPQANFLGHADVAPGRKTDPSRYFPWKRLAEQGFGIWCDPPYEPAPVSADTETLLQALGYDAWNDQRAIGAFKLHFTPEDPSRVMREADRSLLYCLVLQKRALASQ